MDLTSYLSGIFIAEADFWLQLRLATWDASAVLPVVTRKGLFLLLFFAAVFAVMDILLLP